MEWQRGQRDVEKPLDSSLSSSPCRKASFLSCVKTSEAIESTEERDEVDFDRLVENFGESARSKSGNDSLTVVAEDVMSVVMSAGILKVHPVLWFRVTV